MKCSLIFIKFLLLLTILSLVGCRPLIENLNENLVEIPVQKVIFINLDSVNEDLIENVAINFEETFNVQTEIRNQSIDFQNAYNSQRQQYDALEIIKQIGTIPSTQERVFAFTDKNMFSKKLAFVFSSTDKSINVGVVSTFYFPVEIGKNLESGRLEVKGEASDDLILERTLKTLYRNFGATLGIASTSDKDCIMTFSNSVYELDQKSTEFCEKNKEHFKKLGMYK